MTPGKCTVSGEINYNLQNITADIKFVKENSGEITETRYKQSIDTPIFAGLSCYVINILCASIHPCTNSLIVYGGCLIARKCIASHGESTNNTSAPVTANRIVVTQPNNQPHNTNTGNNDTAIPVVIQPENYPDYPHAHAE